MPADPPADPSADPSADTPDVPLAELRQRALAQLAALQDAERAAAAAAPTEAENLRTLHELRVHQIELELQNEELRRTQVELEASRQRWFELYDLAPVGYCTVSLTGLILQANLAAAELLGQPRAGLARRRLSEFVEPADQGSYYTVHTRLVGSGEPQACELRMRSAAGTSRWVQLSASAAEPSPARTLRIVLVDITDRKLQAETQAALLLAEQTQRERNEFLSRVSHELRTPLNAILGFSQVLLHYEAELLSDRARKQLQHIHDAGMHLLQMVIDLLDVSRAATGHLTVQLSTVDLLAVLREATQDVAAQALAAGIHIEVHAPPQPEPTVRADPTRLRQVLQNLLSNAVKYNRSGGLVVARVLRHGPHWRIFITDNGLGMTAQQQAGLFQPFNRLGREAAGVEGTGLGLVIARDLVQAMGGRMAVRSEAGSGSEFLVELPAAPALPPAALAPHHAAPPPRADVAGRVLCLQADPILRELLRSILQRRPGLAVEMVESSAQCMAAGRRAWPDLLLLGPGPPEGDALDVLKVLRQFNPHLPLQCLLIGSDGTPDDRARARAAGAEFLAQPIDPESLLSMIDQLAGGAAPPQTMSMSPSPSPS